MLFQCFGALLQHSAQFFQSALPQGFGFQTKDSKFHSSKVGELQLMNINSRSIVFMHVTFCFSIYFYKMINISTRKNVIISTLISFGYDNLLFTILLFTISYFLTSQIHINHDLSHVICN